MQMKSAVLVAPGRFEVQSRKVPEPAPGEVLVKITRVGICGTDIHIFNGHYAADSLPMVPGHELAGRIAALGSPSERLSVGQKAVVDMNIGCGVCHWCRRQEILSCPSMDQIGITMDGAFSEYICVPERLVIPAPDHVPDEVLALVEPLACVVRAARKSNVTFGQSVVVIGAGPIGNLHVQLLRTIGAAPIIVTDLSAARVDMARAAGADVAVADPAALYKAVMDVTEGRGADMVIESVGNPALYRLATTLIRKGGHIAAFGLTGAGETLAIDILSTILQENSIKGSVAGIGQDMHDALTLLVHGRIDPSPFTSAVFGLDDIQTAFDTLGQRPGDLKTQIRVSGE